MEIKEQIKEIKQSFRLMMDGMVAASMRNKGVDYKLNWGATLPRLKAKAEEIGQNYDLAIALWKENVRECKILATMLMPAEKMLPEVADIWMEQTDCQEIAEQATFNLYQYLPYAPEKAYTWIASDKELYQLCGFHILSRLFMNHQEPNERGINEFIDQALAALQGDSLIVKKAAMNAVMRFAELGLVYERLAKSAVERLLDNYLEMNNHRKTPERYSILRAVYSIHGHFTIDELKARLDKEMDFPVSRATLYNTLNLFLSLRLVIRHRFQGSTKYEACYDNQSHCHQICSQCGKVTEIKSPEIIAAVESLQLKRFRKDGFTLYIYGICSTCQAKSAKRKKATKKKSNNKNTAEK